MSDHQYADITRSGLWSNNVALVQILGLCPLLAVTNTTINGLGLGIATTLVLVASSLIVSLIRNIVRTEIRLPAFVMIIASLVTAIELAMNAWFHELFNILGIFIPLIVTNCAILGRAESFAVKNPPLPSVIDALAMGVGFMAVLIVLGAMREAIGSGTLFADAHLMFGDWASILTVTLIDDYRGFLLAILPPGAFIGLGLLIALKNYFEARSEKRRKSERIAQPAATAAHS